MKPTMREIARATAAYFEIDVLDLYGHNMFRKFAWPRQIAMTLCREIRERSLPEIGHHFGGRDHTTVMHARDAVLEDAAADIETFRAMMTIAALATGYSIDRQKLEREWAQELHSGQPLVEPAPPPRAEKPRERRPVPPPAPPRRIMVVNGRGAPAARPLPPLMPSDLAAPSLARMMGPRA